MAISRYNTFEDLAVVNNLTVDENDIVTGQTSGAVGVVIQSANITTAETGTARAGAASTIQLKASPANNFNIPNLNFGLIRITAGTGSGQIRRMVSWANATRTATVSPNWGTNPDNTSVYSVEDRLTVALISGNFTAGGETIQTQNGAGDSATVTQTGTGTSVAGTTYRPSNVVIVTGDYSATTNIFNAITGSLTVTTDYTSPSASSQYLAWVLGIMIYIGRRDQSADTIAYTQNEMVDWSSNVFNILRAIGNSSHPSTFQSGIAEFIGDVNTAFPPLRSFEGSKFYASPADPGYYGDTNSNISFYNTGLKGADTGTLKTYGNFRVDRTTLYHWDDFTLYGTTYFSKLQLNNCVYSILPIVAPTYCSDLWISDSTGWWIFYLGSFESLISGVYAWDDNGDALDGVTGNYGGVNFMRFLDSHIALTTVGPFNATLAVSKEHSLVLTALDEAGNAVSGATVTVNDKNGYNVLCTKLTAKTTALMTNTDTTFTATPNNDEINIGDTLRLHDEQMTVSNVNRDTEVVTVSRGANGTTARWIDLPAWIYKIASATTDVSGQITGYNLMSRYVYADNYWEHPAVDDSKSPFTVTVRKSGYKTYKYKFSFSGTTPQPVNLKITLSKVKDINASNLARIKTQ